jgi:predicted negative regulator of RcsB-dependent stress response
MVVVDKVQFLLQNWEVIVALILFVWHALIRYKIIRSESAEKVYEEAVRYGNQVQKLRGKKGITMTGDEVLQIAVDYAEKRLPWFHALDMDKIEVYVNKINAAMKS